MKKIIHALLFIVSCTIVFQGCTKEDEVFEDPYGGGKPPLGVRINRDTPPVPAEGGVGTEVTISVTGLLLYKDDVKFMFNGQEAEILSITENNIKVKVPDYASSGITSIAIGEQLVIGPKFNVAGLINVDPSWAARVGANGVVNQYYELQDGRYLLVGGFTNYDNKGIVSPLNRIVKISPHGDLDRSFRTGRAANGTLNQVIEIDNKFIIAGGFSGYGQRTENISNITSLNSNGTVDTMGIHTYRRPDQTDTIKYFPKFNGGTNSGIGKIYNVNGKVLATGNFRYYVSRRYDQPNYDERKDTVILDSIEMRQIVRMNSDGSLDKTYRFDQASGKGPAGANGPINSFMHTDGVNAQKLVVYGSFTTFDGVSAGRIVRLNPDGTIDPSFNSGAGANNNITSLTYNEGLQKYVVTGQFTSYNGHATAGIAVINLDGSADKTFTARAIVGGYASFAKQLNDGLIVVSGGFKTYNSITRSGFMVLSSAGELAPNYNSTGVFSGNLRDVIETESADGKRALLLIGSFNRFDNQEVNNIIRVTIE